MSHYLDDDFTPDPEPLPVDGEEDSLNRLAQAEPPFDGHLRDVVPEYEQFLSALGEELAKDEEWSAEVTRLLEKAREAAGADRIRQARSVETNLRAELEAQRAEERKAAGICPR